ncbi:methyltransferase family protein [Aeropyrum camini]|uniref:Isoprenylcysteine carboxylmethyltransferase family protein n=1 Tax=Aeropyrum camini SY1 = JCM 12091 TaxID=1198449 RepID=U3TER7_9CREN|nr:isoprenylcysteine carboxylmethyltransferase family protein [Aeropyrum camini]BAN90458.1 putative protein-S-isoprenylcysteine methyltransferase [Aeropyrum camini SY1 = JCM 12091]
MKSFSIKLARLFFKACNRREALAGEALAIAFNVLVALYIGKLFWRLLGVELHPGYGLKLLGGAVTLLGLILVAWVLTVFRPLHMLGSTLDTSRWFIGNYILGLRIRTRPRSMLVTHGPYRCTRNPLYLGVLTMMFGLGLIYGYPLISTLLLYAWFTLVIRIEEKYMEDAYGEEFRRYALETPSLIPGIKHLRRCLALIVGEKGARSMQGQKV